MEVRRVEKLGLNVSFRGGSLSDCYGTIQSATGVGVGIAVMVMTGMIEEDLRP